MATGVAAFDTTLQKTNEILKEIASRMGWEERKEQAYSVLRVVLQTLRDRLPLEEASHLGSQLPMLMRGMYYEGYNPSAVPVKWNKAEFLQHIQANLNYQFEQGIQQTVSTVLSVIMDRLAPGEVDDIKGTLPAEYATLFEG